MHFYVPPAEVSSSSQSPPLSSMSFMSFHVYFDRQVHKNWFKKSLNFAESNAHPKTNARGSFETEIFCLFVCLFSLINDLHSEVYLKGVY